MLGAAKVVLSQRAFGQKVLWLIEEVYLRLQRLDLLALSRPGTDKARPPAKPECH